MPELPLGDAFPSPDKLVSKGWIPLVAFIVVRVLLVKMFFPWFFRTFQRGLGPVSTKPGKVDPVKAEKRVRAFEARSRKFAESAFYAIWYTLNWGFMLYYFSQFDWFTDINRIYHNMWYEPLPEGYHWWYITNTMNWVHGLIFLLFVEGRRSDFAELAIHHLTTILLLVFSYLSGYLNVGVVVVLCHEPADILLESAKASSYLKLPERLVDAMFVAFASTWVVTRLTFFPFKILYHASSCEVGGLPCPLRPFLSYLLAVLVCLHVFWFVLIVKMIYRFTVVKAKTEDIRESDNEVSDDEDENLKVD